MDDMQTPSQGFETSPLIFGHAWKIQNFCATPTQPIDACKEHKEREAWAQLKCGVIKSPIFESCHSEVPVEKYLKRCIFDSCACDQGGDCECLCTAIAAYAYSCSQKGVNIRWRTPHFCPMQCDPHCSEYKSCTPPCASETCDNFLDQGIAERMCNKENCMEGCYIKPCDDGMIYLNESYTECVPKSECKPVCMVKEGKTLYEGDVTYVDDCSTCRCSKKKEVCSGVKCIEKIGTEKAVKVINGTTQIPMGIENQPKCVRGWTRWFDKDKDNSGKIIRLNDEEKLPRYDRMESIYGTCQKEFMKKAECRVVDTNTSWNKMDENVSCNLEDGLACVGQCHDYEIRAFCQCDNDMVDKFMPTEEPEIGEKCDLLVSEYKEFSGDCHKFLHCQPNNVGGSWMYVEKTCGDSMMFNPTMNICDHIATVMELKPICGKLNNELEFQHLKECPENAIMSDCANQCEHTCHYYKMILKKRGLCKKGEHCLAGCVDTSRPDCKQQKKFWRDENTCVDADECPCMDKNEKYVQPHMPVFGEWEVCQCIDNSYSCMPNKLVETTESTPNVRTKEESSNEVFPTAWTPPISCSADRFIPMIQGDDPLPDKVFNASSHLGPANAPYKGRLYTNAKEILGSWSPNINDQMQYLQVSFDHPEPLYGVIMAGSPSYDNYVTLFKILYSHDGEAYHYLVDDSDNPQMFNGPIDSRVPIQTSFRIPIEAKSVRFYPLKWHGSIAMRVELLGCDGYDYTTTTERSFSIMATTTELPINWENAIKCTEKMGVENGKMNPKQVKASSTWQLPKPAKKPILIDLLKLSSPVGWKPAVNTPNEYIEFNFLEPRNISGFITKGGPDGWVSSFKVLFSKNKLIWNKILSPDGQAKVFPGNHDSDTENIDNFTTPILTQYFKIMPVKWEKNINLRIEPLGCFEMYLEVKEEILETEKPKCLVCNGVIDRVSNVEECICKNDLYWNGSTCVQSNLCPCVDNYIAYPIGSKYENKECEECVCILGSHSNCKPKKCPPCERNLRSITTSGCFCKCEPCPKYQKVCPSSGDCIPELLWCNGVRDCADDEDSTCKDKFAIPTESIKRMDQSTLFTCPDPVCPSKMEIKIIDKKARKMSKMFSSSFSKKYSLSKDGEKITETKVITSSREFLQLPNQELDVVVEDMCSEFICAPIVNKNESVICMEPKCPDDYDVEVDMSNAKPGDCQKYMCVLRPRKDDVCELSGKSFTTFDGTEFKYDTCSHILARDFANSSWIISVYLQCDKLQKICQKKITVKDIEAEAILTILPNMELNFNGFDYAVSQLINSPICKASFIISQLGKTVLVVSRKHGYWILYDDIGYIKIGVSSKYIKTVDGLCGYYNGVSSDDKRIPNGTVISNTVKFGDSWFDNKVPREECYPQICPLALQKKSLALCNSIKHPTFIKCGKSVNYKQFVSKCMETTCECLRTNNGDINACKCNIMQDFVKKCLTVNPNIQLDTWRAVHQCEISCVSPLVHSDCYKRRCEPSCDTLNADDCPIIHDACFSGCYCTEGTVRKGLTCVPITECKDCVCNSFGTSKYFTYDHTSFTFEGNCTYLLSRNIVLPGVHTFQVYVTMDNCRKLGRSTISEYSSCAVSLHVLNGDHVIHIQRVPYDSHNLHTFVDGFEVRKIPYKDTWISLQEANGKELILRLPEAHLELTVAIDELTFSLGVPSVIYGSKMEGLCGDCNGNPNDDLLENPARKKGRRPNQNLVDVIQSWQADEPKLGLDSSSCQSEDISKDVCHSLPPEKDPCMLFFNEELFGKCTLIVDPVLYVNTCKQDVCKLGSDYSGACDSLREYAKECAKQGICLNWRRPDLCPMDCPADTVYQSCGCAKTCDTIKSMTEFDAVNMKTNSVVKTVKSDEMCLEHERFEGCFCSPGKVMENGKCLSEELCVKCDDLEHMPGQKWKKDKCTECTCNENGKTMCVEKNCFVEENICSEGYKPQKIISEEQCCPRYACLPEPFKLNESCLEPLMPVCGPGQFKKTKTGSDGCLQYICECKPKEECEIMMSLRDLKPGEKLVKEVAGCCPTQKIVCDKSTCPEKPNKCVELFYEIITKQESSDCCPSYICAAPSDKCIVQYESKESAKFTKKLLDRWIHPSEPCKQELCAYGPNDTTQIITTVEVCDMKCPSGFIYVNKDPTICCGECLQTDCIYESQFYKPNEYWKSIDNCTTYSCIIKDKMLMVSSFKESCPDTSNCPKHLLFDDGCCQYCKAVPDIDEQNNCLPVSLVESETTKLIRVQRYGHGDCVNEEPIQGFTECVGSCNSGSKYNAASLSQDKICNCCSIKSYKTIVVPLVCDDGLKFTKSLKIPEACSCVPCTDSEEYHTEDNIDVRLHPLPISMAISTIRI